MSISKVKAEIIALMAMVQHNKMIEAQEKVVSVLESINEGLDLATSDEDIVMWSKFKKIVEDLNEKISAHG